MPPVLNVGRFSRLLDKLKHHDHHHGLVLRSCG